MQEQDNNIVDLTKQTYINKANIETLQVDITSIKNKQEQQSKLVNSLLIKLDKVADKVETCTNTQNKLLEQFEQFNINFNNNIQEQLEIKKYITTQQLKEKEKENNKKSIIQKIKETSATTIAKYIATAIIVAIFTYFSIKY